MRSNEALRGIPDRLLLPGTDIEAPASQIFHGYELASMQWAHGRLDVEALEPYIIERGVAGADETPERFWFNPLLGRSPVRSA